MTARPVFDHHTHLFSPPAQAYLEGEIGRTLPPSTAAELLPVLDRDHVAAAAVLSVAYLFDRDGRDEDNQRAVRTENDWVLEQALTTGGRLVPFFSVNPLSRGARDEIERCVTTNAYGGLKLHFANSKVHLTDRTHLGRLAKVFKLVGDAGVPVVLHLRTNAATYDGVELRDFVRTILPLTAHTTVQVAHAGGWGGYDNATASALDELVLAVEGHGLRNLQIDLSAVVRQRGRAEPPYERRRATSAIWAGTYPCPTANSTRFSRIARPTCPVVTSRRRSARWSRGDTACTLRPPGEPCRARGPAARFRSRHTAGERRTTCTPSPISPSAACCRKASRVAPGLLSSEAAMEAASPDAISVTHGPIELRDPREQDRAGIVGLADDDRLFGHMMMRFSRPDMDGWFTAWLGQVSASPRSYWPLVIDVAGDTVGFVMLSRAMERVAEIQWYVTPTHWGRGYASAASRAALHVAFETLGMHRVFATVDPANEPSLRILERARFRCEGHMRDYVLAHNGWRDRYMYALLEHEWRAGEPDLGRAQ